MPSRLLCLCFVLCLTVFARAQTSKGTVAQNETAFTPIKKWAMVIGAGDYTELGKLNYAAKDAEAFADVLKERFDFQPESIELITDKSNEQKPTAHLITTQLEKQLKDPRLSDGDLFIFYFSGHGLGTPNGDYLMPTDASLKNPEAGLNVKEITERFVKAGLRNVLIIVDACRGGEKNQFGDDLRKLGKQANIAVLLSCEPGSRSYEYPRLGHGVFTSFLIKSLNSVETRSEVTGALWASRIATDVSLKVNEYTKRDYPDQPQTPTGWSEKTMDVVLGVFPLKKEGQIKVSAVLEEAKQMRTENFAQALRTYANEAFSQDRFSEAAEIFRTIDGLLKLEPIERFQLGISLQWQGRHKEMANEFAKVVREAPDSYAALLSQLSSPDTSISEKQRIELGERIWKGNPDPWTGLLVWTFLHDNGLSAAADRFLASYLQTPQISPRLTAYLRGQRQAYSGDWKGAQATWQKSLELSGTYPTENAIQASIYLAIVNLQETQALEGFLKRRTEGEDSASWCLGLADYYKELNRTPEAIAQVERAFSKKMPPSQVLRSLRIVGLEYPKIAKHIVKYEAEHPFAWEAKLAKTWVTEIAKGPEAIMAGLSEALKFCDDEFAVLSQWFLIAEPCLEEIEARKLLPPDQYATIMLAYASILTDYSDQFGTDFFVWALFNKASLLSERYLPLYTVHKHLSSSALSNGSLVGNLRAAFFQAAINMGDRETSSKLLESGKMFAWDLADCKLALAIYDAVIGDSSMRIAKPFHEAVSPQFAPIAKAYDAHVRSVAGEKVDLKALTGQLKDSPSALQIIALTYIAKNDWKSATPLIEKVIFQRQLLYSFLSAELARCYFDYLQSTKNLEVANSIAYSVSSLFLGVPLTSRIHYGNKASKDAFAGVFSFDVGEFEVPSDVTSGRMRLSVTKDGAVTGSATIGDATRQIAGNVDQWGNLSATVSEGNSKWMMTGKVAPPALYQTLPMFKTGGQAFLLLNEKGQARYLIAKPKP